MIAEIATTDPPCAPGAARRGRSRASRRAGATSLVGPGDDGPGLVGRPLARPDRRRRRPRAGGPRRAASSRCRPRNPTASDPPRPETADLDRLDLGRARFDVAVASDVLGPGAATPRRCWTRCGSRSVRRPARRDRPQRGPSVDSGSPWNSGPSPTGGRAARPRATPPLHARVALPARRRRRLRRRAPRIARRRRGGRGHRARRPGWPSPTPCPIPGLDVIQAEFREHADARDDAEREARRLREILARPARGAGRIAHRRAEDALAARPRVPRRDARRRGGALLRDEEFGATTRDLLARLDEVEPLRRERDAAHRHALAAEARCRALELRIEHVLMEFPRRVLRKAQAGRAWPRVARPARTGVLGGPAPGRPTRSSPRSPSPCPSARSSSRSTASPRSRASASTGSWPSPRRRAIGS